MAKDKQQPPEIPAPKILRAFKPGDIVFLECQRMLTNDQMAHLNAEFKRLVPEVKVVILQAGITVAAASERSDDAMSCAFCDGISPRGVLEHAPNCTSNSR